MLLYLVVNENSMGGVLGQLDETDRKERASYLLLEQ